jgi:NMD protein affecting ribosome stability and mRNA decay
VNDSECSHQWGSWTSWIFYGSDQDIRERFCKKCPETEPDYRSHVHDYKKFEDPYAPIGSGLMVEVCKGCGNPKG